MLTSARRNISYPNPDHSDRPDVPVHMKYLVDALELDMVYTQGTNAQRTAASHMAGVYFHETDTGLDYYDDGSSWNRVGAYAMSGTLAARPAANTVPTGTFYKATDNGIIYMADHVANTWAVWSSAAASELDYAQITTNSGSIAATTEATAVAVITGNSITYDGGRVKLEAFFPGTVATAVCLCTYVFIRDSTAIGQVAQYMATAAQRFSNKIETFDTPAAGAHTYKVSAFVSTSNVVVNAGAGGAGVLTPAYLRVTRAV